MTDAIKGALQFARTTTALVLATVAIGSLFVGVVLWVNGSQSKTEARAQHKRMTIERTEQESLILDKLQIVETKATVNERSVEMIGRDIKTIKCILLAPRRAAKAKCGLQN